VLAVGEGAEVVGAGEPVAVGEVAVGAGEPVEAGADVAAAVGTVLHEGRAMGSFGHCTRSQSMRR
jgi:hypothetical protein